MTDVARTLAAVVVWTTFASCTLDHLIGRGEAPGPPEANTVGMGDGGQAAVTCYVLDPLFRGAATRLVSADMASGLPREVTQWTTPQDMNLGCGMAYDGNVFLVPAHNVDGTSWYALSPSTGEVQLLGGAGCAKSVGWTGTDWVAPRGDPSIAGLGRYPTLDALLADTPSAFLPGLQYAQFTAAGDGLYGINAFPHAVEVRSLSTGKLLQTAPIDPWGSGVSGMSVVGSVVYLLSSPVGELLATIFSLDLDTGALVARAKISGMRPSGLYCAYGVLAGSPPAQVRP